MSGLPAEYFRFGLFAGVSLIVSFVAEGMGLAIGATFSITVSDLIRLQFLDRFEIKRFFFFHFYRRMAVLLVHC